MEQKKTKSNLKRKSSVHSFCIDFDDIIPPTPKKKVKFIDFDDIIPPTPPNKKVEF